MKTLREICGIIQSVGEKLLNFLGVKKMSATIESNHSAAKLQ